MGMNIFFIHDNKFECLKPFIDYTTLDFRTRKIKQEKITVNQKTQGI